MPGGSNRRLVVALGLVVALVGALSLPSSALGAAGVRLHRVASLSHPVYVTAPRGDDARVFVVQQSGQIRVIKDGRVLTRPFLNISDIVGYSGERGLLSMAFAPDYATTGRFYVDFTDPTGNIHVEEFKRSADPDVANRGSRRTVLVIGHRRYSNHNGGQLQFGAGYSLYISTGDGGGGGDPLHNAQNINSLLGKILRIDPRRTRSGAPYSIPTSNPFRGRPGRDEIWDYGLRNPWRFSFDRATGNMAIGDVGQDRYEEVDFAGHTRSGANFGWNCFEGFHRYSDCNPFGYVPPVLEYSHDNGNCAVTGGYVVRDRSVPRLYGRYVYGDFCTGELRAATLRLGQRASNDQDLGLNVPLLTSFGEDARGRIYAASDDGPVYRLEPAP